MARPTDRRGAGVVGRLFPGLLVPEFLTLATELEQVIAGRNDHFSWDTANYFDWFADAVRDAHEIHRLHVRDAEVAGSNPVAPTRN